MQARNAEMLVPYILAKGSKDVGIKAEMILQSWKRLAHGAFGLDRSLALF